MNELYEYRVTKRLSVHSKIVLVTTLLLTVSGTILIFLFEYGNEKTLGPLSEWGKVLGSFTKRLHHELLAPIHWLLGT